MSTPSLYPPGPAHVPAELRVPTRAYRRQAWFSAATLLAFVAGYLGLMGWFGLTAYRMLSALDSALVMLTGIAPLFAFLFMLRGLFAVKRSEEFRAVEITAAQEPKLFAFLHRVADEAGAPRPHRVFLSADVNAAVFYDLSVWNLIFPSRKNLVLGLGLMNVLTLSEIKAVVAHEFGHFAQSTMAIGRWTHVAEQIVAQVVAERGVFDRILDTISRVDVRVAWIGWGMRLFVWSLRSLLDTAFRGVVWVRSALGREMELNADLVAVSLTGSDCLVHALHKLHAADEAYENSLQLAQSEFEAGRPIEDLFAVQAHVLRTTRDVLADESYGQVAPLPEMNRAAFRIFPEHLVQAPRMWATHPASRDREDNAKRHYIPSMFDDRSAFVLLADADATRKAVTRGLLQGVHRKQDVVAVPLATSLEHVARKLARSYHARRYRGVYLGRSVVRAAVTAQQLYEDPGRPECASTTLDALYPESVSQDVARLRELEHEQAMLRALKDGLVDAPGGVVKHRGRALRRRDLGPALVQVERDLAATREALSGHDRACRSAHIAAARATGRGWEEHLLGLGALLHYAEHTAADLEDAHGELAHTVAIACADGRVSEAEAASVLASATDLHAALRRAVQGAAHVRLPEPVASRMNVTELARAFPQQALLAEPSAGQLGDWLAAVDSWIRAVAGPLNALASATLEVLVAHEALIASCAQAGTDPGQAPEPASVPARYKPFVSGSERKRQTRLSLSDRFLLADGALATVARLAVAGSLLGCGIVALRQAQHTDVYVYNALVRSVAVDVGGHNVVVAPGAHVRVSVLANDALAISSRTTDSSETIETFEAAASEPASMYVYNVASAAPLLRWTAAYGTAREPQAQALGAPRWIKANAQVLFEPPPSQLHVRGSAATRTVLSALDDQPVEEQLGAVPEAERVKVALSHARWDNPSSSQFADWVSAAGGVAQGATLQSSDAADRR